MRDVFCRCRLQRSDINLSKTELGPFGQDMEGVNTMARVYRCMKWVALLSVGGTLFAANGCLPANFFAGLLGDTIVTGITSAVLDAVLANNGL